MSFKLFSASWCAPCSMLKKYLDAKEIEYEVIDIDEHQQYVRDQGIRGVPTLVVDNDMLTGLETIKKYLEGQ